MSRNWVQMSDESGVTNGIDGVGGQYIPEGILFSRLLEDMIFGPCV